MIKLVNTVVFIVINEENKVLLLKEVGDNKQEAEKVDSAIMKKNDLIDKDEWFIPVGNFGDEDDPRLVIKKEIKNNLGCDVGDCNYFNLYFDSISDSFIKKAIYFYGNVVGEIKLNKAELTSEWIELEEDELDKLNLPQEQKTALKEFSNFLQNKFMEEID